MAMNYECRRTIDTGLEGEARTKVASVRRTLWQTGNIKETILDCSSETAGVDNDGQVARRRFYALALQDIFFANENISEAEAYDTTLRAIGFASVAAQLLMPDDVPRDIVHQVQPGVENYEPAEHLQRARDYFEQRSGLRILTISLSKFICEQPRYRDMAGLVAAHQFSKIDQLIYDVQAQQFAEALPEQLYADHFKGSNT